MAGPPTADIASQNAGFTDPSNLLPKPTWLIVNTDNLLSVPVLGQFDPKAAISDSPPIWQKKPGILGAEPWIKYIGKEVSEMTFEFLVMANSTVDVFPVLAWERLNELAKFDPVLGRPPMILFTHGMVNVKGFITGIPETPIEYWGMDHAVYSRIVRQIGPVRITITKMPDEPGIESFKTNYVVMTEETNYEELADSHYGDARYGQSLALYNQGKVVGDTIEIPKRSSRLVLPSVPVAPFLDDPVKGT